MSKRVLIVHLKSGTIFRMILPEDEAVMQTEIWADWVKYYKSFNRSPHPEGAESDFVLNEPNEYLVQIRKQIIDNVCTHGIRRTRYFAFGFLGGTGWGFPLDQIAAMDATVNYDHQDTGPGFFTRLWYKLIGV